MKSIFAIIASLLLYNVSHSQSLGVSIGLFETSNYSNTGYGLIVEYDKTISSDYELTILSSILYNSDTYSIGKLEYFQIPINMGIRYYLFTSTINPYVSLEGGISYLNTDQISTTIITTRTGTEVRTDEIFQHTRITLGIGTSIGSIVRLNDNLDISINAKFHLSTDSYANYLLVNGGIKLRI